MVNGTTTKEICCPGFHNSNRGRCKRCPKGTYGLDCLNKCDCTGFRKCDRRTGECQKCKKKPCEDDDGGDDDKSSVLITKKSITSDVSVSVQTTTDSENKNVLSTVRTCDVCKEFGNCSSEQECSVFSDLHVISTVHTCDVCEEFGNCSSEQECSIHGVVSDQHDSDSSRKTDKWTIIIMVLSVSVIGNVIAFVLGFRRYQRRRQRKQSQTAPVIQLTNEVNNGVEANQDSMAENYMVGYSQMTDDCHSYNVLDNNRAYVSMYNVINDINQYTNDMTLSSNDLHNFHSAGEIETARHSETVRHSVENDYETVE
ncbi:uncharacterized protein LOC127710978 [Mytilus californianus]|uniref:uncharacterized protein LOC127710978 n=1 Tax=Mytilus californianus TaxID=6549 RepID=UPI0022465EA6|nr:uncharacterized protein LOC127710978 [Mytilus californianus]